MTHHNASQQLNQAPEHAGDLTGAPDSLPPRTASRPPQPLVLPSLGQQDSSTPDLLLSFQRPDGSMSTPRPDGLQAVTHHDTAPAAPDTASKDPSPDTSGDYFSAAAVLSHSVDTPRRSSTDAAESRRSSRSADAASHHSDPMPTVSIAPQSAAAAAPSTSTSSQQATADPADGRMLPRRSLTEYPQYPNQAHAALHSQIYPDPYRSTRPGSAGIHPLQTAARADKPPAERPPAWIDRQGDVLDADRPSRTVGNTPISSPGTGFQTYTSRRPRGTESVVDETSPAPSPYLHPVQGHIPKETTRAQRDVDTISGRKTINQYEIQHELGRGVHGKVKLARNLLTGEYVAIKIVQRHSRRRKLGKTSNPEDKVKREIAILKKTNHPNVVSLIEVIDDPEMTKIYIVLEFCDNHEVQWRTPGASEIVIMEHRRLAREKTGEDDDMDTSVSSDRIMRAARKRREKAARTRRKPLSRINSMSDFWSLEYAEESDDEDFQSQPSSSLPGSQSAPLSRTTTSHPNTDAQATDEARFDDEDVPPDHIPEHEVPRPQHEYANQPGSNFDPELHRQGLDLAQFENHLNLSGFDRGRQHSVAESTVSRITEYMEEEIEEEHRYVPTMTLSESRAAFRDAVLGVEYLHYQGIVHRDIKPANLLRKADYRVKISDFGVSYLGKPIRDGETSEEASENETNEHEEDTELAKTVGTPAFYAPELCSLDFADDQQRRVTGQIDVWALGVTLYCLLYARTPFTGENEFMVMRHIAEEEVFISKKRLRAVDTRASSRSNSHGPLFRETREHRLPGELVYEDIDEDLMDLLKRLFIKDPAKRISLTEIKHHPWVLRDIVRPQDWIEETTPHRQLHGKKIEISKEEVADAVIPLKVIERAKSMVRNVAGVFGFGSRAGRKRAQSNASSEGGSGSAASAGNSESSSKGRRPSERPGEVGGSMTSLTSMLSRGSEHHPLSQSVTASPEATEAPRFFDEPFSFGPSAGQQAAVSPSSRPSMPARGDSSLSTAASIKTIRQADIGRGRAPTTSPPLPTMQTMPLSGLEQTLEPPQSIATVLGKAGDSLMQSMLNRENSSDSSPSLSPSLTKQVSRDQFFGMPSTAVATASASGQVQSSSLWRKTNDYTLQSALHHPTNPKASPEIQDFFNADVPRASSPPVTDSSPLRSQRMSPVNLGGGMSYGAPNYTMRDDDDDEEYHSALKKMHHRRQLEDQHDREAELQSRSPTSIGSPCPPSPDDEVPIARRQRFEEADQANFFLPLSSPAERPRMSNAVNSNPVSSGSSFDQLHSSGMSQSTSYPSEPSIASANTEYPNASSNEYLKDDLDSTNSSDGTAHDTSPVKTPNVLDDFTHRVDQGLDDDDPGSDDSDADLVMMAPKRKTPVSALSRTTSHSSAR